MSVVAKPSASSRATPTIAAESSAASAAAEEEAELKRVSEIFANMKARDLELIMRIMEPSKYLEKMKQHIKAFLQRWKDAVEAMKNAEKKQAGEMLRNKAFNVLRTSTRGQRTIQEKEYLQKFIINCFGKEANPKIPPTIPYKQMSAAEMDQLCNEIDYIEYPGRSIVFLQGDFGNVFYLIARGEVGIYLEFTKDKEMTNARDYSRYRAKPFPPSLTDLSTFGKFIVNLPVGKGFGEAAILKATNKFRNSTIVTNTDDVSTVLLVLHVDTYNAIMRRHHFRHLKTKTTIELLQQLPLFMKYPHSQIAAIAYTMKSQEYSVRTTIVKAGQPIKNVLLIASGEIKVFPGTNANNSSAQNITRNGAKNREYSKNSNEILVSMLEKRLPALAVAQLGYGQIIGENELHKGASTFAYTYVVVSSECEILEIPIDIYRKQVIPADRQNQKEYLEIKKKCESRQDFHIARRERAHQAIEAMMTLPAKNRVCSEKLNTLLPMCTTHRGCPSDLSVLGQTTAKNTQCNANSPYIENTLSILDTGVDDVLELDAAMLEFIHDELSGLFPNSEVPRDIPKHMFFEALERRLKSSATPPSTAALSGRRGGGKSLVATMKSPTLMAQLSNTFSNTGTGTGYESFFNDHANNSCFSPVAPPGPTRGKARTPSTSNRPLSGHVRHASATAGDNLHYGNGVESVITTPPRTPRSAGRNLNTYSPRGRIKEKDRRDDGHEGLHMDIRPPESVNVSCFTPSRPSISKPSLK